jgi:hypothetical protein
LEIDPDRNLTSIDLSIGQISLIAKLKMRQRKLEVALSTAPLEVAAKSLGADDIRLRATREAILWIRAVHSLDLPPSLVEKLLGPNATEMTDRIRRLGSQLEKSVGAYTQGVNDLRSRLRIDVLASADLDGLIQRNRTLMSARNQLPDLLALNSLRRRVEGLGLGPFLTRADAISLSHSKITSALLVLLAHSRADQARRKDPVLGQTAGAVLEASRQAFADRDKKKIDADRAAVRSYLLPAAPRAGNGAGPRKTWTEMALIRNELAKQQRFVPIRKLFERSHHSLQAMMPCFMMSPLSLAKFLPAGSVEFDVAIIDEASQVKPEDALGGLLRAKQIVVVGDPKQLPPTNFFNRADGTSDYANEDEEYDDVDDESILEACQKAFRQVRRLKWHYRSRCESLIAFSNREFYENSLITFPMARPRSFSIDLVHVNGVYQGRQNVAEALRVAEDAITFMRRHASYTEEALPTLGIAAVNIEQRDLIREELRRLSAGDEKVDEFIEKAEKRGEPVFVKNLENVQGDERDFILISMTYGREPGATVVKQRFGPINSKQGHRRLNVLFTRARQRIGLFT